MSPTSSRPARRPKPPQIECTPSYDVLTDDERADLRDLAKAARAHQELIQNRVPMTSDSLNDAGFDRPVDRLLTDPLGTQASTSIATYPTA